MSGYCYHCKNTGAVDCYCGGDLCICENYGEMVCPACHGECDEDEDDLYPEEDQGAPPAQTREDPRT